MFNERNSSLNHYIEKWSNCYTTDVKMVLGLKWFIEKKITYCSSVLTIKCPSLFDLFDNYIIIHMTHYHKCRAFIKISFAPPSVD